MIHTEILLDQAKRDVRDAEERAAVAEERAAVAEKQAQDAEKQAQDTDDRKNALAAMKQAQTALEEHKKAVDIWIAARNELDKQVAEVHKAERQVREALKTHVANARAQAEEANQKADAAQARIVELEQSNESMKEELGLAQAQVEVRIEEQAQAQAQAQQQQLADANTELERQLGEANTRADALAAELEEANAELTTANALAQQQQQQLEEAQTLQQQLGEANARADELQQQLTRANTELEEAQAANAELTRANAELEQARANANAQAQGLQQQLTDANTELEKTRNANAQLAAQASYWDQHLSWIQEQEWSAITKAQVAFDVNFHPTLKNFISLLLERIEQQQRLPTARILGKVPTSDGSVHQFNWINAENVPIQTIIEQNYTLVSMNVSLQQQLAQQTQTIEDLNRKIQQQDAIIQDLHERTTDIDIHGGMSESRQTRMTTDSGATRHRNSLLGALVGMQEDGETNLEIAVKTTWAQIKGPTGLWEDESILVILMCVFLVLHDMDLKEKKYVFSLMETRLNHAYVSAMGVDLHNVPWNTSELRKMFKSGTYSHLGYMAVGKGNENSTQCHRDQPSLLSRIIHHIFTSKEDDQKDTEEEGEEEKGVGQMAAEDDCDDCQKKSWIKGVGGSETTGTASTPSEGSMATKAEEKEKDEEEEVRRQRQQQAQMRELANRHVAGMLAAADARLLEAEAEAQKERKRRKRRSAARRHQGGWDEGWKTNQ